MRRDGRVWIAACDVTAATGWTPDAAHKVLAERTGAWSYGVLPSTKRRARVALVAADALGALMEGCRYREGQLFRRWINDRRTVAELVDAEDFEVDCFTHAQ